MGKPITLGPISKILVLNGVQSKKIGQGRNPGPFLIRTLWKQRSSFQFNPESISWIYFFGYWGNQPLQTLQYPFLVSISVLQYINGGRDLFIL